MCVCHYRGGNGGGGSVPHIAVPVPDHPQEVEAEGQQGSAQQVPQSCQVGDGEAVRVFAVPPHGMDHPVRYTQEQQDLREEARTEHRSALRRTPLHLHHRTHPQGRCGFIRLRSVPGGYLDEPQCVFNQGWAFI